MRLQLRVRHSLGARMLEVEASEGSAPLACGRDRDAAIQVPVGTVSPRHCLIWLDEGQWVIQDGGSDLGTYVNGQDIGDQPSVLRYGDVITLGQGAGSPTIEVDPQGVARRAMRPVAARAAAPAVEAGAPPQIQQYAAPLAQDSEAASPAADVPMFDQVEPLAPDPDEYVSIGSAPPMQSNPYAAPAPSRTRTPRRMVRKQDSSMMIPWAIGGAAVIMLGGVLLYMAIRRDPLPPPAPKTAPPPVVEEETGPRRKSNNIFDDVANQGKKKTSNSQTTPKTQTPIVAAQPQPQPQPEPQPEPERTTVANTTVDPGKQNEEWKQVEAATSIGIKPVPAIWTFNEYLKNNPGKYEAEVKGHIDTVLDRLWWERIAQLQKKRDRLIDEIAKIDADLAGATDPDFKKDRELEKKPLASQRDNIISALTEDMAYDSKEVPNVSDDAQIARLRGSRDKAKFEAWSKRVFDNITTRRKLPWVED